VAYCDSAVLYDEQPTTFSQSWRQRLRWARGYIQVFGKYGGALFKRMVTKLDFAVFDMLMTYLPAIVLTIAGAIVNIAAVVAGVISGHGSFALLLTGSIIGLGFAYLPLFAVGVLTTISEWNKIHCSTAKKLGYLFTFPLFMLTYIPVSIAAVFCTRVEWKPIRHSVRKSLQEVRSR
jgi:cellulose synthase/poly-beta-1,6-N-acetylglucosamine synthase-like glycosyltransferase